jgi:DNA-binding IclR family transcriptional regulator
VENVKTGESMNSENTQDQERKYYQIGSLEKGLKILEAIIENGELTVSKAATLLGLNRASAHRFIATLRDMGYVHKNQHNGYEATFKLLELGMRQADKFEIRRIAKPLMRELSKTFAETVNLGLLDRGQVVYLDKVESCEPLRMDTGIGTSSPAYCTGLGKAILAFLPEAEMEAYLKNVNFVSTTKNTISTQEGLLKEMVKIRKNGYAVDNEELSVDLYCVAAPIFDFRSYPSFALSISGPVRRLKHMTEIPKNLISSAEKLSEQLGFKNKKM